MKAIILAGGFGTRLQKIISDVPKPMAPIRDKPFLAYLLDYLQDQGIAEVVLSVHFLYEKIQAYFKHSYHNINIQYAIEETPLGTGGAIQHALSLMSSSEPVFVLNGDTFLKLNYAEMWQAHQKTHAAMTIALRKIADCTRYGTVVVKNNVVTAFQEKGVADAGLINAGVYLLNPNVFAPFVLPNIFSIEQDFLFPHIATLKPNAFIVDDYFIDIGIPEDYQRAILEL